jgi:uracil-DNA glycosylase family 4
MLYLDKKLKFDMLVENASRCDLCPRMNGRRRVLSNNNGDIDSKVIFVGEAPGRLGADRTGIPFYGDQAGRNFERLLQFAGLERGRVFITNAVLCNPRDERGNNSSPTREEVRNCSIHLSLLIDIIEPEYIVPLGRSALSSLRIINSHQLELRQSVRKLAHWGQYAVVPMYHPAPRSALHRSMIDQIGDFSFLGEIMGLRGVEQRLL